jgi:maltose O-acetyltransferase
MINYRTSSASTMTEKEKMIAGEFYDSQDPELAAGRARSRDLTRQLAAIPMNDEASRQNLFRQLLGATGDKFFIENTFSCDYGYNIFLGENFYANFNCILLDDAPIRFGDNVMLAPAVQIYTATHQLVAEERNSGLEFAREVTIGNNVWIGGGAIINPGVTIGDGAVIGSGSVVTRDIPPRVFGAGNPCRIIREITDADRVM